MADTSWDMLDDAKPPTGAPPAADATGAPPANDAIESFLASHGLAKHAAALIEATDAESCDDLKLLDVAMTEKLITQLGLKLVAAQKLRQAVAALRGEPSSPTPAADAKPADVKAADTATKPADVKAADTATKPSEVPLRECTIICIDRSGSMGTPFAELNVTVHGSSTAAEAAKAVQLRTRMEAVKAMFYAFRDRVDGLGGGTQLGLIQFDNQVETLLGLTPRLERFESIVDDVEKRGQTAIFSAIVSAAAALEPVAASSPEVDLRILVLSDGQNNSGHSARDALHAAHSVGATVDAIIVGSSPDSALRKIVTATGGECYQIQNLGEGFELLENEGVASLLARRGGAPKPPRSAAPPTLDLDQLEEKKMVTSAAPARPPPPPAAARKVQSLASWSGAAGAATAAAAGGFGLKRVFKELKQASEGDLQVWYHSGEGVHIFPSEVDVRAWRVLLEGPPASPFEGGVFSLLVTIPDAYPLKPPSIVFETPVYHCNVSEAGGICLDILKEQWSPNLTVPRCLEAIRIMLARPDTDNALRQWIAELTLAHGSSGGVDTRYLDEARAFTRKHAASSVEAAVKAWSI